MDRNIRYVCLTNDLTINRDRVESDQVKANIVPSRQGERTSYKVDNNPHIIWTAPERKDIYYSQWEDGQLGPEMKESIYFPGSDSEYAVYYAIKKSSYVTTPQELLKAGLPTAEILKMGDKEVKSEMVKILKKATGKTDIEDVICEINPEKDIPALQKLMRTEDKNEIVKAYVKLFSAVFWNNRDKADEWIFQVPTLMIFDPNCVDREKIVKVLPIEERVQDKERKEIKLDASKVEKLLNAPNSLQNAIKLERIYRYYSNPGVEQAICEKKNENKELKDKAEKIIQIEESLIRMGAPSIKGDRRKQIEEEIISDRELSNTLQKDRETGYKTGVWNDYSIVYAEMMKKLEEQDFLAIHPITKEDISKIQGIKEKGSSNIQRWINSLIKGPMER